MKGISAGFLFLLINISVSAQNVFFPNALFKALLVGDSLINTNADAEIQVSEAAAFSGRISTAGLGINDITGINAFTALTELDIPHTVSYNLTLTTNTALTYLNCSESNIANLNISALTSLSYLDCNDNFLDTLDFSPYPALTYLNCSHNPLHVLNISANPALTKFIYQANPNINLLTTFDFTANPALKYIDIAQNLNITSINISNNPALTTLKCFYNALTSLNISSNPLLDTIQANSNGISSLDVSTHTGLIYLDVASNIITSINVTNSPLLKWLNCYYNRLSSIDVSHNTALIWLDCAENYPFASLDVSANTSLIGLGCETLHLTSLDVTNNTALTTLTCHQNYLTSLDLSHNTQLKDLRCSANSIPGLDISANTALTRLYCNNMGLPGLNLTSHIALKELYCQYNQLSRLELPYQTSLTQLNCSHNLLTSLDIQNGNNSHLVIFDARNNSGLNCIQSDNPGYLNAHFSNFVDTFSVFSLDCSGVEPILGNTFRDLNSNCIYDSSDVGASNIHLNCFDSSNVLIYQIYSMAAGNYRFNIPAGTYRIALDTLKKPYTFQCAQPGIDTLLTTSLVDTTNFDVICNSGFDLKVNNIVPIGVAFPGVLHTLRIKAGDVAQFHSLHCISGIGGTLVVTVNGPITYQSPAPGAMVPVVSGNTYTYTIPDFGSINNYTEFGLVFRTDTIVSAFDSICVTVTISPASGIEKDSTNNTLHLCYAVLNSYDPNTKETYPQVVSPSFNNYFTYKVNFQNTGTAAAINIKVKDTLSPLLDLSTFELLDYSHPCAVSVSGNVLKANFSTINLADSTTNEAASHGYFQYRIKPLLSLPNGTLIYNTAHIYFDYNIPVATNTTVNTYLAPNSIKELRYSDVSIFPNPSSGLFTLSLKSNKSYSIKVYNVIGEIVYQLNTSQNNTVTIDLTGKPKGVYAVRIKGIGGVLIKKIIVQ